MMLFDQLASGFIYNLNGDTDLSHFEIIYPCKIPQE